MVEMGWRAFWCRSNYGGSDLGYLTFGVVLEELGKQLVASPLFASALVGASALLLGGNDAQKKKYLPAIVDGSEIVTLAVDEGPRHAPARSALQAKKTAGGFSLSGAKTFVPEGMAATTFVVAARTRGAAGDTDGDHAVPRTGESEGSLAPAPQHVRQPRLRECRIRERRSRSLRGARHRRQRLRAARRHPRSRARRSGRGDARHRGAGVRHDALVPEDARAGSAR
jgi:hypothetical protein